MEPPVSKSLTQGVIDEILLEIKSGNLKRGDKLPSQRELVEKLNVGRSCIREALQALALVKVINTRPGRGSIVSDVSFSKLLNPVKVNVHVKKDELLDLLEVRIILETYIARLAARRASGDDLTKVKGVLDLMESFIKKKNPALVVTEDFKFHEVLAKSTHNKVLLNVFSTIYNMIIESLKTTINMPLAGDRAYRSHNEIYKMVKNKDEEGAAKAMLEHLNDVKNDIMNSARK